MMRMQRTALRAGCITTLTLLMRLPAAAQGLPSGPVVVGDGRVTLGGDVSVTASCSHADGAAACSEDSGFFNDTDYGHSTLRMVRAGLNASVRLTSRLSLLSEVRLENADAPQLYGLYLRVRPFPRHDFDIQIGRVPETFGAFPRRTYSSDNPLIGYPLAYQYLLSLRPDAVPANVEDLFRMRGRGWLSTFPIGNQIPTTGIPIAQVFQWDTGVQLHGVVSWLEAAGSVTKGSLADPVVKDNNSGQQWAGRLAFRPLPGLIVGVSGSRAPFVAEAAAVAAGSTPDRFVQSVVGADAEYSRDHYLVRFETVDSHFTLATIDPRLDARASMIEGRYKLTPRVHLAIRADHLGFNTISSPLRSLTWEAPVTRVEFGGGYALQRNVQLRLALQRDTRDGGRVRGLTALAAQLLYGF
jgi:hypothetical protein